MDRKEARIAQLDLFSGCRRKDVAWIASTGDTLDLAPGSVLAGEGSPVREFVVILSGEVSDGEQVLRPGDHFGHKGLIHDVPHASTMVATTPVRLLVFSRPAFTGLLELPSVGRKVMRELVTEIRELDRSSARPAGRQARGMRVAS